MVLDAAYVITQYYTIKIKGKVEQIRERSSSLSMVPIKMELHVTNSIIPYII